VFRLHLTSHVHFCIFRYQSTPPLSLSLPLLVKIHESFTGASSIRLEVESGLYDQWKRVLIMDYLCSYQGSNLQRIFQDYETMTSCPTPGLYQLDTYFTVPQHTVDTELHYTPDVRIRFFNAKGRVLGCATTGTLALGQKARIHAQQGSIALMVAFFSLACMFSTLMYLNCGRDRRLLRQVQKQAAEKIARSAYDVNDTPLHQQQQSEKQPSSPSTSIVSPPSSATATGSMRSHRRPNTGVDDGTTADDQRYHYFNGEGDNGLNGSSDFSQTSNASSAVSSMRHARGTSNI